MLNGQNPKITDYQHCRPDSRGERNHPAAEAKRNRMKVNKVKRVLEHGGVSMGTMMLEFSTTGICASQPKRAPNSPCSTWSTPVGVWRPSEC